MRVALVSPPAARYFMRNGRCDYISWSNTQWYPIWLSYCGALLESKGHSVALFDCPAQGYSSKQVLPLIHSFRPDLCLVYPSGATLDQDIEFSRLIKELTSVKLIFCGPFVFGLAQEIMKSGEEIDGVVYGEFDYPVLEIAQGRALAEVKNLAWRSDRGLEFNPLRPALTGGELDNLPFVTEFYSRYLDLRRYRVPSERHPFVDLFTSRGCYWGRCSFCLWPQAITMGHYAQRSISNVIGELRFVKDSLRKVRQVFFQDDALSSQRAEELSGAILDAGLKLEWGGYVRANIGENVLKLMRRSGCRTLHVGFESADEGILESLGKGLSREEMTKFSLRARRSKIRIHGDFLFGLPGESLGSIRQTIEWAKQIDPETAQFLTPNLYRQTPLYAFLQDKGFIKDNHPDYPGLSAAEINKMVRRAYLSFYFRPKFILRMILDPGEYLFPRFKAIIRMLQMLFLPEVRK